MVDEELTREDIQSRLADIDDRKERLDDALDALNELREAANDLRRVEGDILDERSKGTLDAIEAVCWRLSEDLGQVDHGIHYDRRRLREARWELDQQEADDA